MNIQARIDEGRMVVEKLLSEQPIPFKGMCKQMIPTKHGIYAIKNCSTEQFLYAGKSEKAKDGLRSRSCDSHLYGNDKSDFAEILVNDRNISVQNRAQGREWMKGQLCRLFRDNESAKYGHQVG